MKPERLLLAGLLLLAATLATLPACAQEKAEATDPVVTKLDQRMTRFLDNIVAGDVSDAFGDLLAGSQLVEQQPAVNALIGKAKEINQRYGQSREHEQLSTKRVGKDLVLVRYLLKCEKFPVIWHVVFYRNFARPAGATEDTWVVISVRFDTQIEALFEE